MNTPLSQYVTRRNDCPVLRIEMSSQNDKLKRSVTELVQEALNLRSQYKYQEALSLIKEAYEFEPENQLVLHWYNYLLKDTNSSAFEILRFAKLWYECSLKNSINDNSVYEYFFSARLNAATIICEEIHQMRYAEALKDITLALSADNT
jgi:hypothetical protein